MVTRATSFATSMVTKAIKVETRAIKVTRVITKVTTVVTKATRMATKTSMVVTKATTVTRVVTRENKVVMRVVTRIVINEDKIASTLYLKQCDTMVLKFRKHSNTNITPRLRTGPHKKPKIIYSGVWKQKRVSFLPISFKEMQSSTTTS